METVIDDFIRHKKLTRSSITTNTSTSYSNDLILFLSFLKEKKIRSFENVTSGLVEDFYTTNFFNRYERVWRDKSNKVVKKIVGERSENSKTRIISSLSSFFKYLVYKKRIDVSPIPKRRSRNQSKSQTLDKKEIDKVLRYINSEEFKKNNRGSSKRDRSIVETLYYCGLRVSELIGIKMDNLKLNNSNPYMLIYGKGGKLREQPVPAYRNLVDYIKNERPLILDGKKSDYLFISAYGKNKRESSKPLTRHGVDKKIKQICLDAGLNLDRNGKVKYKKISAHMFRHTIGTHLHESGYDIVRIRDHLGHSSVATTGRYIGNFKEKEDILKKYGPFSGVDD